MASNPLEELFGAAQREQKPVVYPMREAQVDTLWELFHTATEATSFKKGELVRYIGVSGPLKPEAREKLVLMFWRRLTDSVSDTNRIESAGEVEMQTLPVIDCLLAVFDGRNLTFQVASEELLVRDTR